jgi:hypothetical protein
LSAILVKRTAPFLRSNIPQTATATLDTYVFLELVVMTYLVEPSAFDTRSIGGSATKKTWVPSVANVTFAVVLDGVDVVVAGIKLVVSVI